MLGRRLSVFRLVDRRIWQGEMGEPPVFSFARDELPPASGLPESEISGVALSRAFSRVFGSERCWAFSRRFLSTRLFFPPPVGQRETLFWPPLYTNRFVSL